MRALVDDESLVASRWPRLPSQAGLTVSRSIQASRLTSSFRRRVALVLSRRKFDDFLMVGPFLTPLARWVAGCALGSSAGR